MPAHRMHVTPRALDRIVEKDAATPRRAGLDAPIDCLPRIPFAACAHRQWNFVTGAGEAHHLSEIAEHAVPR
jgi:hypothetical protein